MAAEKLYNLPDEQVLLTEEDVRAIVHNFISDFKIPARIKTGYLQAGSGANAGGTSAASNSTDVVFWAGANHDSKATAPFRVQANGAIFASSATVKFGGDGSDGALSVTSGTTTISLGSAAVVIRDYTSISITSTGTLAFSSPHANGTIGILKSQGAITLTSSSAPMIDYSGMGAAGGAAGDSGADGTVGNIANSNLVHNASSPGNASTDGTESGNGGTAGTSQPRIVNTNIAGKMTQLTCGAGGGGAGGSTGGGSGAGGAGGTGGGALYIECAGAFNFTTTSGISVAGVAGSNGTAGNSAGGGGGGGGGVCVALYNTLTANTGTITVSGGAGGSGTTGSATASGGGGGGASQSTDGSAGSARSGTTGGNGGAGGAGFSITVANNDFA